jgi:hypothetical protein
VRFDDPRDEGRERQWGALEPTHPHFCVDEAAQYLGRGVVVSRDDALNARAIVRVRSVERGYQPTE